MKWLRGLIVAALCLAPVGAGAWWQSIQQVAISATATLIVTPSITGGVTDLTGGTVGVYTKSIDAGTYSVGRVIVLGVMCRVNSTLQPTSVLIGSIAAVQAGTGANNASVSGVSIWYWDASNIGGPVTTNGAVSVVVTFATAPSRCGFSMYSIYGASASAPSSAFSTANSPVTENTVPVPTGGSILAFNYATGGYPTTLSATSFTQDVNSNLITTQGYASLHSTPGALSGTPSVTVNATGGGTTINAWAFASWGP